MSGSLRRQLGGLVRLALPLCLGHLGQQFMTIVDLALLGHYSSASLAGAGLAHGILFTITMIGIG
ncbi:MAG TPA: MATE family efflux transporter, partial [Kofleriaceae bacterium]|nr:MATE family efflux transporter [Kofleriaceae bacterium]